jgi:hypothetical protein
VRLSDGHEATKLDSVDCARLIEFPAISPQVAKLNFAYALARQHDSPMPTA